LGLKGGLKSCEQRMGIGRPGLEGIDGFVAPLLWDEYHKSKNVKALETLLAYTVQDVLSLHTLMVQAYNQKVKATPFASYELPMPIFPKVPFEAAPDVVERVLQQRLHSWPLALISPPPGNTC